MFSNAPPPSVPYREATRVQLGQDQRSMVRLTSKVQSTLTRIADLKREVLAALCPAKRPAPSFSNDVLLKGTSKTGPLGQMSLSASVVDCLTRGAKAARAKPCPPPPR